MICPNCSTDMTNMTLDAHLSAPVDIDLCTACQAFWFDKYESLKLAPGSTLRLIKLIGEHSTAGKPSVSGNLECPRCGNGLLLTHDMTRNARFNYWRCNNGHGRFIGFFDFLREKNFIRPLSPQEIAELRQNIQVVNCSNCGGPIDLTTASVCTHCGSPLSMLDMKQPQELLNQLKHAAEPRPVDPTLPFELARVKRETERWFGPHDLDTDWWGQASSSGVVEAGLSAVVRWLSKAGI
jgi:ssDNA-binding Zn-finger/Zn-ribbon topoisomerase 1